MSRLLLFDIDGTLILTGGAGGRAMLRAAEEIFGSAEGLKSVPMAGRTDAWIVAQMAAARGFTCTQADVRRFHDAYIPYLEEEVRRAAAAQGVLPGVRSLLDTLTSRDDVYVALLTGNFQQGARIKLGHFDLWRYFAAGAFGDEAHDRNSLLQTALDAVRAAGGPLVPPADVVIIGDTPLDIAVAVASGARSLGVATGSYDRDALVASGADVTLPDLDDQDAVLRALELRG